MSTEILAVQPLGFPWPTSDPFLFCVHHDDAYPAGNADLGPAASLAGREIGSDFGRKDGWSMYHGEIVPGFPQHPHRGFETVTVVRAGLIDHSDSLGATARYGGGDTQWLTAGGGIVHAEMFPLVAQDRPNPAELFQIWLNLPAADKMAPPHFAMLWNEDIPRVALRDGDGRAIDLTVIAGRFGEHVPPPPQPPSWAARPENDVAIWTIRMDAGATWTIPRANAGTNRTLFVFHGEGLRIAGRAVGAKVAVRVRADADLAIEAADACELLLLQGRPIGEPVASYGPFVMNTRAEIERAFQDYRRTGFGGWPWPVDGPVHPRDAGRFARRPDCAIERAPAPRVAKTG
jgi:quercetin 2,3-dioxygenase